MCKKKSTISKQINIISKRNRNHELYFHIVYEWEDCLGNLLNIPVKPEGIWTVLTNKACKQLHFPVLHTFDFLSSIDCTNERTNGWNQVTPRFLEENASQCHIIARYPNNEDTK